jgi:hypothetical protein
MVSSLMARQALALMPLLTMLCAVATAQQSSSPCTPAQSNAFEYGGCCYQCNDMMKTFARIRIDGGRPKCVVADSDQVTDPTSNNGSSTCLGALNNRETCSAPEGMLGYSYNGCCYHCSGDTAPNGVEFQDGVLKCSPGSRYADIVSNNGSSTCIGTAPGAAPAIGTRKLCKDDKSFNGDSSECVARSAAMFMTCENLGKNMVSLYEHTYFGAMCCGERDKVRCLT